ncbi:otoferlin [Cephus cinctus]|uniref:Otoferlin n=1 Tax=Cephus cinctus TaxID=211228 RepID=A0AAJ7W3L6_CEPCN|nr:otoferlin [Cephus cinctus]
MYYRISIGFSTWRTYSRLLSIMACTSKCTARTYESYQICVTIIEAKHLVQNANPLVIVKVGNRKKRTMIRERTDNPYYNEYFVFDFNCSFDVLLSTRIGISVYLRNCLRQLKFYGGIFFEVATVWDQPDHQYFHKWAMLTNPKDAGAEPKGYVKCNITVNAKGQKIKVHPETDGENDIEGNLLLPMHASGTRQRARYIFTVYRADGLPSLRGNFFCCCSQAENVNPYVQISFAGMKGKTSEQSTTISPYFNERIIFKEMFPPLSHRVRISLKHRASGCRSSVIGGHILNLGTISNSGEYGFLPIYGPSFVHFYESGNTRTCCCSGLPVLPIYRGRVLLSLRTEIEDPEASSATGTETEPAAPIIEKSLWNTEEYLMVGVLYSVCMIDRSRFTTKWISFEISLGNAGNTAFSYSQCSENSSDGLSEHVKAEKRPDFNSNTVPRGTATMDKKYNYLPLGENKPCMYVKSWWPNLEWRIMNSNNLRHIATILENQLEIIESLIAVENPKAYVNYNDTIEELKEECMEYLHLLDTGVYDENGGTTKLDRHRVNLCRREIEDILKIMKINGKLPNNNYIRIAMTHAYKYLYRVRSLVDDPQHHLPDIFLWMIAGSSRVACARISSADVMYAEEDDVRTRGEQCGRRLNLFLKNLTGDGETQDYSACTVDIFLWLGNVKYGNACWSALPPGYEVDHEANIDTFPRYIKYTNSWKFQLRAHIFQGRFSPGMDTSGLLDPLIRVIYRGHTLKTEVINQTLDPLWDQTLVFPPVQVYGTADYIKTSPPKIVIQAFDSDLCGSLEFCGRCVATPIVKMTTETYSAPDFPPKLKWYKLYSQKTCTGEILAAFELIEAGEDDIVDVPIMASSKKKIYHIPDDIKPKMTSHRIEVIFWGVRDMKKLNYIPIYKPRIVVECAGVHVRSEVMENAKKFCNFEETHIMVDLDLPELEIYYPSVIIKVYDSRGFGCFKYVGVCIIPTIYNFIEKLITDEEYESQIYETKNPCQFWNNSHNSTMPLPPPCEYDAEQEESKGLIGYKKMAGMDVYSTELEMQPEFRSFQDRLTSFELLRGKRTGDPKRDEKNIVGKFKGHISIYRWPHPQQVTCKTKRGRNAADGLCDDYPSQEPLKLLVRLYVVKGINLHPSDPLTGKSDPYLYVKLGRNHINGRKDYIPNQLNPTFGKLFEMEATFPKDYLLTVQVWDYDATSSDDLIGETKIDIENRFYSLQRASCGIAKTYSTTGYNAWRDRESPTQILEFICKKNNLPLPEYRMDYVKIGKIKFWFNAVLDDVTAVDKDECMALNVLHQWQNFPICGCTLVPEHVERRALFNDKRHGLEQGKLELWIDMFQVNELPPKVPIDISPQLPKDYEIRIIIWNTEDVPMVDNQFLTGEKCSDIYLKGWIVYEDHQKTDVHYNSLTGEGNFNWRFIFRVTYSKGEHVMIIRKKMSIIARDETEQKIPCKLHLQVWDSDHFSPDDFLGSLTLDLARMPKGSANSKNCNLKIIEPNAPTINAFKVMRTKAWWPFIYSKNDGTSVQAGKVEMEINILSAEEADAQPVGRGRDPPEPLPLPNRPDTSYSWFRNPWKACRFVVCRYYKWRILGCCCCVLLVALAGCGIYAFPGYFVKRILGA